MENWIDLSTVPKIKTINKEICDWKKAEGCICKFYNNGIYGEIKLGKYNKETEKIEVEYDGYATEILAYGLVKNNISQIVKKKKELFIKKINSEICDQEIKDIIDFYVKDVNMTNIGLMKMI